MKSIAEYADVPIGNYTIAQLVPCFEGLLNPTAEYEFELLSLVEKVGIYKIAEVMETGARKYQLYSYKDWDKELYPKAFKRHLEWIGSIDPTSGFLHEAHAMCNALIYYSFGEDCTLDLAPLREELDKLEPLEVHQLEVFSSSEMEKGWRAITASAGKANARFQFWTKKPYRAGTKLEVTVREVQ